MNTNTKILSLVIIAFFGAFASVNTTYAARTVTTCTSAVLKGSVSSTDGNPTTVWFEWGRGSNEGSSYSRATNSSLMTRNGSFEEILTGLSPSTTYYYRALAQNNDGITVGDLETFRTSECQTQTVTKTIVKYVPVPAPAPAPRPTSRVYMSPSVSSTPSNYQYPMNSYAPSNMGANVLNSQVSFNFIQIILALIFILLAVLIVKRIFSRPIR